MKTSYWLAAACLAAALPAHAGFKPIEIQDQELSQLRGRYVMPGRIISFGIVMSSTWRNASGDLIGATSTLQVQQATVTPQFYVTTINQTGNGTTPSLGTGNVIGGAGLAANQGVTQSVRAAGDGNTAYNNVSINVSEANQAPVILSNPGQALLSGQTITGSGPAGSVSVSAVNGGVQMAILANSNQGNTLQQVAQGNVLQNTRLLGNNNLVNNLTQLNVVLQNNGPSTGALDCNLTTLNGLRNMKF
ncbi:hypothetical protein GV819_07040 [Pseudomonas sp. Fl5BN2]|uniref:hypothetical protein n=1 Tax=Pseudomonas sp. Fl5BN2 TaxID=2697652 RepID=UPI0013764DCB|nr:hypothetical protein [Pseudomonas sp. Fl5BN2]NBF02045.1 hypothetical protein [Pseudomonas sp. Fl5BN2]